MGRIAFVQESRIRMTTPDGRGLLLTLGHRVDEDAVRALARAGTAVAVEYRGQPGLEHAEATRIRPLARAAR